MFSRFTPLALVFCLLAGNCWADPSRWKFEWPRTDFTKHNVDFSEIRSGGPPKDGIPPIDNPQFASVQSQNGLQDSEPVIGLIVNGEAKAYPIRILMWHEIVNDTIGGVPVCVTFCPLCNAAIVFDRRIDGRTLDFGTTGKLRNSDLVMYDRQTQSWWQQFLGQGIAGEMTGKTLKVVAARLEAWGNFKKRAPQGQVLVPNNPGMRDYGANPYEKYDSLALPFLYDGKMPDGIEPLARVVSLSDKSEAWSLSLLRRKTRIERKNGTVIVWNSGQNSALDTRAIAEGKDVGNVVVTKNGNDVPYTVDFAFAFHAFYPNAAIHTK